MCHWNVFLAIILAAWPQTINTHSFPNTSALAPADLATVIPFSSSPSAAPDSARHSSASTSLNTSTSPQTLDSTPSDALISPIPTSALSSSSTNPSNITESTPRSTPQSNVTSNSSFTSPKPSPSNDSPPKDPESTLTLEVTTSTPDESSSSTSDVPSTSDMSSISTSNVSSISTSEVSSTSTSDVSSTSTSDVSSISTSEVSSTSTSDVSSMSTSDVSSISTSDVPSTSDVSSISTSDVSSISTSEVSSTSTSSTSTSDVSSMSTSDVSSISTSNVPPTSDVSSISTSEVPKTSDVTSTSSPYVTPTSPSDVTSESSTEADTTPIPSTLAPTPKWTLDDDRKTLEWDATVAGTVIIEAEEGYKIAVKVIECDIDGDNREFVIIGPGEVGKGVQFSYKVNRQPSYLFNTNVLYVEFYGTNASKFHANFSRVGEALTTTTTEITTSTQFLPTPSVNDSAVISVFVSGRRPTEYADKKVLDRFRDAVHKMATEYCFDQNFDLAEDITITNVNITRLMPCHSSWPGSETCAQITFAVPVYQKEDAITPWQGYQLNSNHLSVMWNRYHKKYIDGDISTFDVPDSSSWVKWQIIVFCSTTVIFLVCLLALKYFCLKFSRKSKSDDMDAIIPISNEDDEVSLKPYYNQPLPPLFENTYQDITPGLSSIIVADVHDDLIECDDTDPPKMELTEEDLGESGA